MHKVSEYLRDYIKEGIQYHIFDSHQEMTGIKGNAHKDIDYKSYTYNIHKNNKPRIGDIFIYRRTGKTTKDRKFVFFGGGVIESISEPDSEGNVTIRITKPFKLLIPLKQGDEKLENFEWTFKQKEKNGSWAHFWSQYGMNVINYSDFIRLVGDMDCEEPENIDNSDVNLVDYMVSYTNNRSVYYDVNDKVMINLENSIPYTGRMMNRLLHYANAFYHMDINKDSYINNSFENICRKIIEEYLSDLYKAQILDNSIIIQRVEDKSIPADIVIKQVDGVVGYINVKATESSIRDGFYLSPQEVEFSKKHGKTYKIYRLYDVNLKEGTVNLKIYEGPFNNDNYRMAVTAWKIYEK